MGIVLGDDILVGWIFGALSALPITAQVALTLGAPLGDLTLGGKYPGRLPGRIRAVAAVQALLLSAIALVVLDRAGAVSIGLSAVFFWVACAITALSTVLNLITPSRRERIIWTPILSGMLLCLGFLIW
ncbi:MAG: hypothetical protein ACRBCL_09370 [Maritimibacter sp.]